MLAGEGILNADPSPSPTAHNMCVCGCGSRWSPPPKWPLTRRLRGTRRANRAGRPGGHFAYALSVVRNRAWAMRARG